MPTRTSSAAVVLFVLSISGVALAQKGSAGHGVSGEVSGKVAAPGYVKPGQAQGFNPQPEPPGDKSAHALVKPGQAQGFNPQPEPPGDKNPGAPAAAGGTAK